MARRRISEAETRKELIDPQLEKAGWVLRDHAKVKIEIPVDGYDAELGMGLRIICSRYQEIQHHHPTADPARRVCGRGVEPVETSSRWPHRSATGICDEGR